MSRMHKNIILSIALVILLGCMVFTVQSAKSDAINRLVDDHQNKFGKTM